MDDDFQPPSITTDITSPHIKGADVLSVGILNASARKAGEGRVIRLEGEATSIEVRLDAKSALKLAAALAGLRIEINEATDTPTTCQVYVDEVLRFDGVDKSVLLKEQR